MCPTYVRPHRGMVLVPLATMFALDALQHLHFLWASTAFPGSVSGRCGYFYSRWQSGYFHELARGMFLALRSHLKGEFERAVSDPASARLHDAHIELYLMLVRASPTLHL